MVGAAECPRSIAAVAADGCAVGPEPVPPRTRACGDDGYGVVLLLKPLSR